MSNELAQLLGLVLRCVIRWNGRGGKPPDQSAKRKEESAENEVQSTENMQSTGNEASSQDEKERG